MRPSPNSDESWEHSDALPFWGSFYALKSSNYNFEHKANTKTRISTSTVTSNSEALWSTPKLAETVVEIK